MLYILLTMGRSLLWRPSRPEVRRKPNIASIDVFKVVLVMYVIASVQTMRNAGVAFNTEPLTS